MIRRLHLPTIFLAVLLSLMVMPVGVAQAAAPPPVVNFPTGAELDEGGDAVAYTVAFSQSISTDVTVTVFAADGGLSFGESADTATNNAVELTFTPLTYDDPQTIYVQAIDDDIVSGRRLLAIRHAAREVGSPDEATFTDQNVPVNDNDEAALEIFELGGTTVLEEGGNPDLIQIGLSNRPPSGEFVTVNLGFDDTQFTVINPDTNAPVTSLVFDISNAGTPQEVNLVAIDDGIIEGDLTYDLELTVTSTVADSAFTDLSETIDVTVIDSGAANLLTNGSFEDGLNNWQTQFTGNGDIAFPFAAAPDGENVLLLRGSGATEGVIQAVSGLAGTAGEGVEVDLIYGGRNVSGGLFGVIIRAKSAGTTVDTQICGRPISGNIPQTAFNCQLTNIAADFDEIEVSVGWRNGESGFFGFDNIILDYIEAE